ncbi:outer membrane protein assembly factor BamB [Vibrio sp. SCSIO 43136]|uniref:outer membrane protein assembly factor BamB n=1 Tax=Vibrio sp. SCSIO 43136 TaxID=2819101 RepID=UPI002074FAFC|nr:outer membrane protein assembly factor BamB [Vibrio sp. SCSIO 43136]USD65802.1 outer membrane protein assembly factor BamB [Vibrio sp. SCSIO 43136]
MKKMLNRALMCAVVLGGVVGCAGEEDTIVMSPLPEVSSQFTPGSEWSTSIGDGVGHYFSKLKPAFAYDKVFVASRDGEVKALDPSNGKAIWSQDLSEGSTARLSGGITASYGKLFIGSENGQLIALEEKTGELLWRVDVEGEVLAAPATDANLVIVHTSRGVLAALNPETGEQVWTLANEVPSLTLRGDSAPATVSGGVFWGTANGRLAAAIAERGQLIWQQPIGNPQGSTEIDRLVDVDAKPLIIGGMLYTVGINGQLVAIDLRSGAPTWKRSYSSASDLATDGDQIYLVTDKDHVAAVDARSGTEIWSNDQLQYRQLTDPVVIRGMVVVADSQGYVHWIDNDTGEFVAQQMVDSSGFAVGPTLLDDGYVLVSRSGKVVKQTVK